MSFVDRLYPPAAGLIDVQAKYGAAGDDTGDDTEEILAAIREGTNTFNTVYFPEGIYRVSDRLAGQLADGTWKPHMRLAGVNRDKVKIKLVDGAPGFQDPLAPKSLLYTASSNASGDPTGGGKDWVGKGEGNEAFGNYIEDITIDAGNNPGAIGLDFLANNFGACRRVKIMGNGFAGLDLERKWPGPAFVQDLEVVGFQHGVKVKQSQLSMTFERLVLSGQTLYGIHNEANVLNIRGLKSNNFVQALLTTAASTSQVNLIDAELNGGNPAIAAIYNTAGGLFLRNISSSGYKYTYSDRDRKINIPGYIAEKCSRPTTKLFPNAPDKSMNLPVAETPVFHDNDLNNWANVVDYGAKPSDTTFDSRAAIQAAIDSGKSTVFMPKGQYFVGDTLIGRGAVRKIIHFGAASVHPLPGSAAFTDANNPRALFRHEETTGNLTVERFRYSRWQLAVPGCISFEYQSNQDLILRDGQTHGATSEKMSYRSLKPASGKLGRLFIENVTGARWLFAEPQEKYARQLDPEGNVFKIDENGGTFWILGMKTEGYTPAISAKNGARVELRGAEMILAGPASSAVGPAFLCDHSEMDLSYASLAYTRELNDYIVHIREIQTIDGVDVTKDVTHSDVGVYPYADPTPDQQPRLYLNGYGRKCPLYRSLPASAPPPPPPPPPPPDEPPTAVNDSYEVRRNHVLTGNVLTNDTAGSSGNPLTAQVVSDPAHGTLALNSDGTFTYTPTTNYVGDDAFTYRANDGLDSNTATVSITVTPPPILTYRNTVAIASGISDQYVQRAGSTYPPAGNVTRDIATAAPSAPSRQYIPSRNEYRVRCLLFDFDTAFLANALTKDAAMLKLYVNTAYYDNGFNLAGEYYDWDGVSASDHSNDGTNLGLPAFAPLALSSFLRDQVREIQLINLDNLSTRTRLRLHVTGGQPTANNYLIVGAYEHATYPEAQLVIDWSAYDET